VITITYKLPASVYYYFVSAFC